MIKRIFDFILALAGIILLSPVILVFALLIWLGDFANPFYVAPRVGRGGKTFPLVKFRSMVMGADRSGVDSTSRNDPRITPLGRIVRRYKIDEVPNLFNILKGDLSFVGPRPNVKRETDLYTDEEKWLLKVRPGITDFASIVFADEGEILAPSRDPDLDYNRLIRPWKSRLGIFYVNNRSIFLDLRIILMTIVALFSRGRALVQVHSCLEKLGAGEELVSVALRKSELQPTPPPGAAEVVSVR